MMRLTVPMILVTIVCTSCVEQISFNVIRGGGQIIIDGRLTDEPGEQRIRLGFTAFSARIPEPITGAAITIYDDRGNQEAYLPDPQEQGEYILPGEVIQGEVGRTYFIEVKLPDGRTLRSQPETMQPPPGDMEDIYYNFTVEEQVTDPGVINEETYINVFIDTDFTREHPQPYFVRWDVEEVYLLSPTDFPDPFGAIPPPCYVYVYTSAGALNLFSGRDQQRVRLEELQVARKPLGG